MGVRASLRARLVERGLIWPLLRGVFVASQVQDSLGLRVGALQLVVPDHAVVVDRTAAWVHGVDALPRSAIHLMPRLDVVSSAGSRMRRPGIESGIRDFVPSDITVVGGLRLTTKLRTACDLGRRLWRYDALAAVDGFLRAGLDHSELLAEVDRFKGHRGVVQLRALAPLGDLGAESPPESALRLHWHDADIGEPKTQIWEYDDDGRPTYRIDVGDPEARYGAEYFGEQFHGTDDEEHDEDRIAWLEEHRDWSIEVFTKVDVYVPSSLPLTSCGEATPSPRRPTTCATRRTSTSLDDGEEPPGGWS
ncbi:hypothetical protein SAMN04489844_3980 [Nocardioides exalbidus]|uniref:Transcriptional regulator, AbiEi antitoxin, Type IV TA system n=2 Tax=Nocardioides exalbidus TaxID=402596 RepID=A0A1H4Z1Q3_9ACTN|nr:hypothetical protein SAMN04489844_3980 [Nocardioides exalbidus]